MRSHRILIVEDDPHVSDALTHFVKKHGYNPSGVATSAEEAIGFIRDSPPDLVFIDVTLEGEMDGISLAQYINENVKIPFIFITACSDPQIIEDIIHTHPCALIMKPFVFDELNAAVKIALKDTP